MKRKFLIIGLGINCPILPIKMQRDLRRKHERSRRGRRINGHWHVYKHWHFSNPLYGIGRSDKLECHATGNTF